MNQQLVISKPSEFQAYLEKGRSAVANALPKHLNPDRMLRLALTCFQQTPKLRECTAQSILASVVVASQLGLEPGVTGQAYLIPYGKTCTLVPGWQGLCGLLNNSGRAIAWTGCVFEGDTFDFRLGAEPKLDHTPGPNFGDEDKIIWVYACGKVNGTSMPIVEAWPIARIWKHRDRFNKVGQQHYSYRHAEMYARKVALLQVLKYLPRSIELQNALVAANAADEGKASEVQDGIVIESEVIETVQPPPVSRKRTTISNDSGGEESRPAKPVGCPPDTDQPNEGTVLTVSGGAGAGSHEQEDPSRSSARPAVTPTNRVLHKCAESDLSVGRLLDYLRARGVIGEHGGLEDKLAQQVLDEWDAILFQIREQDGQAQETEPEPMAHDKATLCAAIDTAGLIEEDVCQYLAKQHKAGAACRQIGMVPESGRKFLAANFDQVKEALK